MKGARVRNLGERLHPIIWKGRQWAVTTYGIECRNGLYHIQKHRIRESNNGHGWVDHMSEKTWVDIDDFKEALRRAMETYP